MGENKLISGLLLASCLLMILAIVLTLLEIKQYPKAGSASAGPVSTTSE